MIIKRIISFVTILLLTLSLFSMELDFFWDTGNIFVDGQLNFNNPVDKNLNGGAKIGSISLKDNNSGFSLSYFPFVWNCEKSFAPDIDINQFYFFNFELFYEVLGIKKNNISLGPYVSLNYLDLINMSFNNYQADLGFKFSLYNDNYNPLYFKPEILTFCTGIRARNNKFSIYIAAGFNLGGFIYGIVSDKYSDAEKIRNLPI